MNIILLITSIALAITLYLILCKYKKIKLNNDLLNSNIKIKDELIEELSVRLIESDEKISRLEKGFLETAENLQFAEAIIKADMSEFYE